MFRLFSFLLCTAVTAMLLSSPRPLQASTTAPVRADVRAMVSAVSRAHLQANLATLVAFGTRNDFSEQLNSKTRGVFAARDWIRSEFEAAAARSGGHMTVALDTFLQPKTPATPRDVTESSIIATLKGDQPGPTYVMSGHYDDCNGDCTDGLNDAPGADDNGSATVAVIEAARAMAGFSHFRGTIVFAIFDGEELGLWGAQHYAQSLKASGANVVADMNNDIIGTPNTNGPDKNTVRLFSEALTPDAKITTVNAFGTQNDSPSRELSRFIEDNVPAYVPGFHVRGIWRADRIARGGDQEAFTEQGFPGVRFVEAHENFYHQHKNVRIEGGVQYGDLLKYIDFGYLARVTQANVAATALLALGPGEPANVTQPYHTLAYQHLGNEATLTWDKAPAASSYEIVWRATDSPQWQHVKNVGNVTSATIPVSRDDIIVGVRSVGSDGLRSVVVTGKPVRIAGSSLRRSV